MIEISARRDLEPEFFHLKAPIRNQKETLYQIKKKTVTEAKDTSTSIIRYLLTLTCNNTGFQLPSNFFSPVAPKGWSGGMPISMDSIRQERV